MNTFEIPADCSGVGAAYRLCIDVTSRRGQVAFVGESSTDTPLRANLDMIRKGLTLVGSWHYNVADTPHMMKMISELGPELDKLISHRFPLDQIRYSISFLLSDTPTKAAPVA